MVINLTCCNPLQGIGSQNECRSNGCPNNAAVIIVAIIALILINILDEETSDCVGQAFITIGDLMQLGPLESCLKCMNNGARCNYY